MAAIAGSRTYRQFDLLADRPTHAGGHLAGLTVRLLPNAPLGGAGPFDSRLTASRAAELAARLAALRARALDPAGVRQLGADLADLLIPHQLRPMLFASLTSLRRRERLRILVNLAPELAEYPWEYAWVERQAGEHDDTGFLALDPRVSLVRYELVAGGVDIDPTPRPRRVVALFADVKRFGLAPLDLSTERRVLRSAIKGVDDLTLSVLRARTGQDFREQFDAPADVFHFAGHGASDKLVLAGDDDGGWDLEATQLAINLRDRGIQVAVLGACESGARTDTDQWAGVATRLIADGIPAVVAMQYRVGDRSALAFSRALYEGLANGRTLDAAVSEGRLAMYNATTGGRPEPWKTRFWRDWGVPVVYLRTDAEVSLAVKSTADAEQSTARAAPTARKDARASLRRLSLPPERPLVDRRGPIDTAGAELRRAREDGTGVPVVLSGPLGIGKSRVAEHIQRVADSLGMVVLAASCIDPRAEPLLPIQRSLASYRGDASLRDLLLATDPPLADSIAFLESFLGVNQQQGAAPLGGTSGQGVYENLSRVITGLAGSSGLCLVVEDLTDADPDTLAFVEFLRRRSERDRVIVVVTAKTELVDSALRDRFDRWLGEGAIDLSVSPLEDEDVAELVTLVRGGQAADPDWVRRVATLTGGNPLFIEQVVKYAAEHPDDRLETVPRRVEALLSLRLRRIEDPADRAFLDAASVALAVTRRLDLVAHLARVDGPTAARRLKTAIDLGCLVKDNQGGVAFAQDLLRRVVSDALDDETRRTFDVRAAEWLEQNGLEASAAHHYERAGLVEDMVRAATAGATKAEQAGTYAAAAELYQRARQASPDVEIGLRLAKVDLILGRWAAAADVLSTLPDVNRVHLLRSDLYFVRGEFDRALAELHQADGRSDVDRYDVVIKLADINLYLGHLAEAADVGRQALTAARDANEVATSRAAIGAADYFMGDVDEAERVFLEAMRGMPSTLEERDRFVYTTALHNLGLLEEFKGAWSRAKSYHEEALRIRQDVGAAREVGHSRHAVIRCEIGLGELDAARDLLRAAQDAATALGERLELGKLEHTEARIALMSGGDPNHAVALIGSALVRFRELGVAYDVAHATCALAVAYQAAGDRRRMVEANASARVDVERHGFGLLRRLFADVAAPYSDRIAAGLLAYAAGDAVGLPWENLPPEQIAVDSLPSLHATENWPAGATSDDTALTLLVAEQLASGGADGLALMRRLEGALPHLKGLGPSTTAAIDEFRGTGKLPTTGGNTNGALMRSLPVGWAVPIDRPDQRRAWTIELARATHPGAEACCAACIGSACAAWSVEGADASLLLEIAASEARVAAQQCGADARIAEMIASVVRGSWRPDPKANVLDPYETLTRALWCLTEASSAADRMLAAVRIGGDTDTVAALVGGLSGAGTSTAAVRSGVPWIADVQLPAAGDIARLASALAGLRVATDG